MRTARVVVFSELAAQTPQLTCSLVLLSGPRRRHGAPTAVASAASPSARSQLAHQPQSEHAGQSGQEKLWLKKGGEEEEGARKTTQRCAGGGERREEDRRKEGRRARVRL